MASAALKSMERAVQPPRMREATDIVLTLLTVVVMLFDCLSKAGVVTAIRDDYDIHLGLMALGSLLMGRKLESLEKFFWFGFVYNISFCFVIYSSRNLTDIIDSDPRPTIRKRTVLVSIIFLEVAAINLIGYENGWTAVTKRMYFYYCTLFSAIYLIIAAIYYYNLGVLVLLPSLLCLLVSFVSTRHLREECDEDASVT